MWKCAHSQETVESVLSFHLDVGFTDSTLPTETLTSEPSCQRAPELESPKVSRSWSSTYRQEPHSKSVNERFFLKREASFHLLYLQEVFTEDSPLPRDWFSSDFLVFDLTVLSWTIPNSRQCPKHLHLDIQLCHICVSFKPPSQVCMKFPGVQKQGPSQCWWAWDK